MRSQTPILANANSLPTYSLCVCAGHAWPKLSPRASSVFNESAVRHFKHLHMHVCFVVRNQQRLDCAGGAVFDLAPAERDACAPCFMHTHGTPSLLTNHSNTTHATVPYWFTVNMAPMKRVDAWCSISTTVLVVLMLFGFVHIFRRNAGHLSNSLALPIKALAKDMEQVSQMGFQSSESRVMSQLYEVSKIQKSFTVMKGILQVCGHFFCCV